MSIEFAVIDAYGQVVDTVDPYVSHRPIGGEIEAYQVDNGYGQYDVFIPKGGKYEIRQMESTA